MTNDLAESPTAVSELVDRAAIVDLISRLGVCLDELEIERLGELFTEDVTAQFPGGEPFSGIEALKRHASDNLPRWERRQHVITNVIVDLEGDEAAIRANLIATHVHKAAEPESHWDIGAYYDFAARRSEEGWRLSKVVLHLVWTNGS